MVYLSITARMNVKEDIVLTMHASNVGDVYFKLVKYMFNVKLTLQQLKIIVNPVVLKF